MIGEQRRLLQGTIATSVQEERLPAVIRWPSGRGYAVWELVVFEAEGKRYLLPATIWERYPLVTEVHEE